MESLHPSCLILKLEPSFSHHAAVVICSLPGTVECWLDPRALGPCGLACSFPTSQGTAVILHTACQTPPWLFPAGPPRLSCLTAVSRASGIWRHPAYPTGVSWEAFLKGLRGSQLPFSLMSLYVPGSGTAFYICSYPSCPHCIYKIGENRPFPSL